MKRILFLFIITMFLVISCSKVPINGDLDGMWKMTSMEWKDGTTTSPNRIFFCFELNCIQVSNKGNNSCSYIGLMNKDDNTIRVDKFKNHSGEEQNGECLKQFGILETPTEFNIEKINHSKLIIKSKDCILYFTKF